MRFFYSPYRWCAAKERRPPANFRVPHSGYGRRHHLLAERRGNSTFPLLSVSTRITSVLLLCGTQRSLVSHTARRSVVPHFSRNVRPLSHKSPRLVIIVVQPTIRSHARRLHHKNGDISLIINMDVKGMMPIRMPGPRENVKKQVARFPKLPPKWVTLALLRTSMRLYPLPHQHCAADYMAFGHSRSGN